MRSAVGVTNIRSMNNNAALAPASPIMSVSHTPGQCAYVLDYVKVTPAHVQGATVRNVQESGALEFSNGVLACETPNGMHYFVPNHIPCYGPATRSHAEIYGWKG